MSEKNSNIELPLPCSTNQVVRLTVNQEDVGSRPTVAARLELECFIGLADSGGLDSLIPIADVQGYHYTVLEMRQKLNSHRSPVIYKIFLTKKDAEIVQFLFRNADGRKALEHIKMTAVEVQLARPFRQEDWDKIPAYSKKELIKPPPNVKDIEAGQTELELDD